MPLSARTDGPRGGIPTEASWNPHGAREIPRFGRWQRQIANFAIHCPHMRLSSYVRCSSRQVLLAPSEPTQAVQHGDGHERRSLRRRDLSAEVASLPSLTALRATPVSFTASYLNHSKKTPIPCRVWLFPSKTMTAVTSNLMQMKTLSNR